jgi:hypothetical protein
MSVWVDIVARSFFMEIQGFRGDKSKRATKWPLPAGQEDVVLMCLARLRRGDG